MCMLEVIGVLISVSLLVGLLVDLPEFVTRAQLFKTNDIVS